MKNLSKAQFFIIALVVIPVTALLTSAEARTMKEDAKSAAKAVVNYPANLVNESVKTVGTAAKDTGKMVVDTGKAVGETITGKPEKAKDIVTTPIVGTAGTVTEAAKNTVMTPIRAGEETAKQN